MASRSKNAKTEGALDPALPQKKRARRRLVGAAAVCLAAAIILPIVLDSEPRQIRDDVQVQIPSRDTPLAERTTRNGAIVSSGSTETAAGANTDAGGSSSGASAAASSGSAASEKADPGSKPPSAAKAEVATKPDAVAKADAQPAPESQAKTELQAKPEPQTRSSGYVVQVGAFASPKGAADQVERVRKVGLKAYTEKVSTPKGERTRVRVGPFASRDAADSARAKLRAAGLETTLVSPER